MLAGPEEVADSVQSLIATMDPRDFVNFNVIDRVPWMWGLDRRSYICWKSSVAESMQVDPYSLVVVGSACTGVSLNPDKNWRPFNAESDVDLAVVSHTHFEGAWLALREFRSRRPGHIPSRSRYSMLHQHRDGLVFDGAIAADWMLKFLPFGKDWTSALDHASKSLPGGRREVKCRIYRDFEALRGYHEAGVARLKLKLSLERIDDDDVIPVATME